jgi:hypothetical protein
MTLVSAPVSMTSPLAGLMALRFDPEPRSRPAPRRRRRDVLRLSLRRPQGPLVLHPRAA